MRVFLISQGMYAAANEIMKKLMGMTTEEIRLEKGKTQEEVSEEEVEESLSQQRMILHEIYSHEEFKVRCVNVAYYAKDFLSCVGRVSRIHTLYLVGVFIPLCLCYILSKRLKSLFFHSCPKSKNSDTRILIPYATQCQNSTHALYFKTCYHKFTCTHVLLHFYHNYV